MPKPPAAFGVANCAWLKRLKNSALKLRPMFSQGRVNCLMTEKSVLTKSGPDSGVRDAFPSSPAAGNAKAHGLNQFATVCTWVGAVQPGLAETGPALFGSPTSSGRVRLAPLLLRKETPVGKALLSTMKTGKPEVIFSITVTCQFPRTVLAGPFQPEPKCLPLPKGKS